MGGLLECHGVPGFLGNLTEQTTEKSPEQETLETLCEHAEDSYGEGWFTASQLAQGLWAAEVELPVLPTQTTEKLSQALGFFLRSHKNQYVNGRVLERADRQKRRGAGNLWRFRRVGDADA